MDGCGGLIACAGVYRELRMASALCALLKQGWLEEAFGDLPTSSAGRKSPRRLVGLPAGLFSLGCHYSPHLTALTTFLTYSTSRSIPTVKS